MSLPRVVVTAPAPDSAPADSFCAESCDGRVTPSLERALQLRGAKTRRCYNRALAADNALTGRVVIRVTIAADGTLCDARVQETDMPEGMTLCALGIFEETSEHPYPAPTGGCCGVSIPMRFVPMRPNAALVDASAGAD